MQVRFPKMIDCPEKPTVVASLFYSILSFFTLPFLLLLILSISVKTSRLSSGFEIAYHVINFAVVLCLFHTYLSDSYLQVRIDKQKFLTASAIALGLIAGWILLAVAAYLLSGSYFGYLTTFYALPVSEVELFIFSSDLVLDMPVFGTVCMALLTPITVSCLFYATGFAPICTSHPKLCYLIVALLIAFPRVCNAFTYWDPVTELVQYVIQLPIHLIACWAYQKADTVWAPIATLSAANLLFSLVLLIVL